MTHFNTVKLFIFIFFLGLTGVARSQDFSGYGVGSWAGINSLHMNPANVVDSRYKVDINLVMGNTFLTNNAVSIDQRAIFDPSRWDQEGSDSLYILKNFDGSSKYGIVNLRVQGPSFMFNITQKDAIAFTSNARVFGNVDDMDERVFDYLVNGVPSTDYGITFNEDFMSGNINGWMEYGLTYGRVILDQEEHFLKAGVTLKLLQGLFAAYGTSKDIAFELGQDTIRTLQGNVNYGHSGNMGFINGEEDFKFKFEGVGFGADLGVVYEWRPNWAKYKYNMDGMKGLWRRDLDKYVLKASLSLVDIGAISYTRAENSRDYTANVNDLPIDYFDGVDDIYELTDRLNNMPGMTVKDISQTRFSSDLPMALIASIDYQVVQGFYLNFTPYIAFNNGRIDNQKVHNASNLQFTVRYENPWFGAYMPIGYNFASSFNWGLGLRLGPVVIGSGNIFSNLIAGDWRGLDIHGGVRIPIPHGPPQDRDGDEVSDKKDKCPDIPGLWEFMGCPDTDRDGIQDSEDDCPTEPGIAEFKGCPDSDGDKIPDKEDRCPTDPGPKELQGCPDRDFDGVIDREDDCPDERGLPQFNGCPDLDGDGLIDKLDQCPTLPGPKEKFGCPDTDGDGIFDNEDQCPTEPGLPELKGCPWADTDKDGVKDIEDKCPAQPGPVENGGCPYADSDGDGVIDLEDKCPKTPGVKENFGCPPITQQEAEVLKKAFDNLEFTTGKSTIRSTSYPSLNELADLLKKKPEYKLLIEGHTDNVGKRSSNMTLSKNRANAVKNYLVKKGVPADRFVVKYYGPDKPIADNDTEEGRQRNRRVEMTLTAD